MKITGKIVLKSGLHIGAGDTEMRIGGTDNPEAWLWYYRTVGDSRCPVVDTWWQTETGGALITNLPGATAMKPG